MTAGYFKFNTCTCSYVVQEARDKSRPTAVRARFKMGKNSFSIGSIMHIRATISLMTAPVKFA